MMEEHPASPTRRREKPSILAHPSPQRPHTVPPLTPLNSLGPSRFSRQQLRPRWWCFLVIGTNVVGVVFWTQSRASGELLAAPGQGNFWRRQLRIGEVDAMSSEHQLLQVQGASDSALDVTREEVQKKEAELRGIEEAYGRWQARLEEARAEEVSAQQRQESQHAGSEAPPKESIADKRAGRDSYGWSSGGFWKHSEGCSSPSKLAGILRRIVCTQQFSQAFDRCALVGSSSELIGKRLGAEIDGHDTVIRVNRVPNERFINDFGNRTDILFAGPVAEKRPMFTWAGMFYRKMGGEYELCQFHSKNCPFKALILKGADSREFGLPWEKRYPREKPGWRPKESKWPLAYQDDPVNNFAYDLIGGKRPTNGFQAFLTFSLLCNSLDVYGFTGSGTADGHAVSRQHNLTFEHDLQRQLEDGSFRGSVHQGQLDLDIFERLQAMSGRVRIVHATSSPAPASASA